ncbi:hypothetical protein M514_05068 [Trichuris suis]|uniref:Uncharacterized protein n=1 Tax=Trichuris suis TaxID=68888 RepID=A0A085MA03_9BILA|nr:hypothetical protein M513_05068 [Trichuris suis]KFD67274.1 hypothetical protein M514_05068 [Trichuris suis]
MAHGIYGTYLQAVWCKVLFTTQHFGSSSDSEVVRNTAQIIDIRLRVKTLDYSQYTPICQNVPASPFWQLSSADEVFIVLLPPACTLRSPSMHLQKCGQYTKEH